MSGPASGGLLEGQVAVVTGGGGGIGRAISEVFAAHRARVIVAEIDEARAEDTVTQISHTGGDARAVVVDVRDPESVAALALEAGPVTVLVNNVGHYLPGSGDFLASDPEEWRELYRVNLEHVFLCTHAFLPGMLELGRGSVVNVSSVEAFRAIPRRPVYSAFKAAIAGFTRSLAVEFGGAGVRVNAIAPDLTETLQVPYSRWVPEEQQDMIPTWVPVGRFGTAADIANVALFLASELSAFVTGTTVHADGGSLAAGGWFRTSDGGWTNRPRDP